LSQAETVGLPSTAAIPLLPHCLTRTSPLPFLRSITFHPSAPSLPVSSPVNSVVQASAALKAWPLLCTQMIGVHTHHPCEAPAVDLQHCACDSVFVCGSCKKKTVFLSQHCFVFDGSSLFTTFSFRYWRSYSQDSIVQSHFSSAAVNYSVVGDSQTFARQLFLSQLAAALQMKQQIETFRATNTFGTLIWQLGEIFPTGGWGSLEYANARAGTPGNKRIFALRFLQF
jgi:hypothetical protein